MGALYVSLTASGGLSDPVQFVRVGGKRAKNSLVDRAEANVAASKRLFS